MNHLQVDSCPSTQDLAWGYAEGVPEDGVFFQALEQTSGRGRRDDRVWKSPVGNLYLSWRLADIEPHGLTLMAGLAVCRVAESYGLAPTLKWPNDCWLQGRKLAGVLADCRWSGERSQLVIGIGLNVLDCPEDAVCLAQVVDPAPDLQEVCSRTTGQLLELLQIHRRCGVAGYIDLLRKRSLPAGTLVDYAVQGQLAHGVVAGLDDQGFLVLQSGDTLTSVDFLRPSAPQ